jgi:uncharacterized membrane protein YqjE
MQQSEMTPPNGKLSPGLLKNHLELLSLEWGFEKQEGWRRLLVLGAGAILLSSAFVYFQIALIGWFLKMGYGWVKIGLILGGFFLVAGMSIILYFGKRQKGLGQPFQGSLIELKRSINWIEKLFF